MSQPAPSEYFHGIEFNNSFYTNTDGGGTVGITYTEGTGLLLTGTVFSSEITQYTDVSLNLALANKAGDNMTRNAQTNTFNVSIVSSGGNELSAANEGTNITIDDDGLNRRINVGELEDNVCKLPYTSLKKPADKVTIASVPISQPVTSVPITEIVGTDYNYMMFTHDGSSDLQITYTEDFTESGGTQCDILVVAGGGSGGDGICGRGGGAGGLVFSQNIILNGFVDVNVGKGGLNTNGYDSSVGNIVAIGGGLGQSCNW